MIPHIYRAGYFSRQWSGKRTGRYWVWVGQFIIGWRIP